MNLRDLRYLVAVAEQLHFGRAAELCRVSQPTLSAQIRKLEEELGVAVFERTSRQVTLTPVGARLLEHARAAITAADMVAAVAREAADPLAGSLRIGIIPTLAPYLLPLVIPAVRAALPRLALEPWEDVTETLLERLRGHELDGVILATDHRDADLDALALFDEPFVAALPPGHRLAARAVVAEAELAPDLLVLADGHCLGGHARIACGASDDASGSFRAVSLATLMNLVAAGFGTTLVPGLAAGAAQAAGLVLRPLRGGARRTVRLVLRAGFPRRAALEALAGAVRSELAGRTDLAAPGERAGGCAA